MARILMGKADQPALEEIITVDFIAEVDSSAGAATFPGEAMESKVSLFISERKGWDLSLNCIELCC